MKQHPSRPAIDVLEQEISAREALDPHFFDELKSGSIKRLQEMNVDPEVIKGLMHHA